MSAFGQTDAGKEASGFSREYGAWNYEQFKQALHRMKESGASADQLREKVLAYSEEQMQKGFPMPEEIHAMARQMVPGLDEALDRRKGRLDQIQQGLDKRVSTGETMSKVYDNVNGQAGDIGRTGEANQNEITDTAGRAFTRNDDASGEVNRNINDSSSWAQGGVNDTFGSLRNLPDTDYTPAKHRRILTVYVTCHPL